MMHKFTCTDGQVLELDELTWRSVWIVLCVAEGLARGDILAYNHVFVGKEDSRAFTHPGDGAKLDDLAHALVQQASGVRNMASLWQGNVMGIDNRSFAVH